MFNQGQTLHTGGYNWLHKLICTCILMCISAALCAESAYDNQQSPTISAFRYAPELLSIDEILEPEYADFFTDEAVGETLSIDDHAVTWIRIKTNTKIKHTNQNFLLIDNIGINDKKSVRLYAVHSADAYNELPRNQVHSFPVFNLGNSKEIATTYYLKFTNKSNYKLIIPLSFLSAEDLQEELKITYIIFGGMLFSLIILALYNII